MFPFEPDRATTARCSSSSRASDLFVSAHDHGAPDQHSMPFWHLALWFMIRWLHRMHVYKSYIWQVTYTRTHSYQHWSLGPCPLQHAVVPTNINPWITARYRGMRDFLSHFLRFSQISPLLYVFSVKFMYVPSKLLHFKKVTVLDNLERSTNLHLKWYTHRLQY